MKITASMQISHIFKCSSVLPVTIVRGIGFIHFYMILNSVNTCATSVHDRVGSMCVVWLSSTSFVFCAHLTVA